MDEIKIDQIAGPEEVIHPCLDWAKGQLIMGVNLHKNQTAVLSSMQGLIKADGLGSICEQGKKFTGAVSRRVAEMFEAFRLAPQQQKQPENGTTLLSDIATCLKKFVVFPQPWFADVLATWILGTNLFPVFQTYPYLWITSPEPGCGKSVLGGIIAKLSFNGEFMVAPTEAQLFHLPETSRGVQVWDEVENFEETDRKRFDLMRPVLLNGYRNGAAVPRQIGKYFEKGGRFHVFCPRVLIGLTKLPLTALQRSIQVRLVKLTKGQSAELYIGANQAEVERQLKERCLVWALETVSQVNECYQDKKLREELGSLLGAGRISDDIWLPILAVASAATGKGSSLVKTLLKASKELVAAGTAPDPTPAGRPPVLTKVGEVIRPKDNSLTIALQRLQFSGPITPKNLARDVSQILGREITAQKLTKGLAKFDIRSKKSKGQRLFHPSNADRDRALQKLSGRQGQEGSRQSAESNFKVGSS